MSSNFKISNFELTLGCAFRYALGRRTYVVSHVVDEILNNWEELSKSFKERTVKEIIEYKKDYETLGDSCDESDWMKIVNKFTEDELGN